MKNQDIIEKIQKLLTRAENNPFAGEAQACILQAQRLMAEHSLSMTDITEISTKEVARIDLTEYARTIWWKKSLASVISINFRCKCFMSINHSTSRSKITYLGLTEDVEIARKVFDFAVEAIEINASEYLKEVKRKGRSSKGVNNTYILGFIDGLEAQFAEQVSKNQWGLILVEDPLVSQAYAKLHITKGRSGSVKTSRNREAREQGLRDGKSFQAPAGRLKSSL